MQIKKTQLQRQQVIMSKLGFYKSACEGIWGPEAIAAKSAWERDPSFIPGLPTNGLPLGDRDPLPQGVSFDKATRLFRLEGMTDEEMDKYVEKASPKPEKENPPQETVDSETVTEAENEPTVYSPEQKNEHTNSNQSFGKHNKKKR